MAACPFIFAVPPGICPNSDCKDIQIHLFTNHRVEFFKSMNMTGSIWFTLKKRNQGILGDSGYTIKIHVEKKNPIDRGLTALIFIFVFNNMVQIFFRHLVN